MSASIPGSISDERAQARAAAQAARDARDAQLINAVATTERRAAYAWRDHMTSVEERACQRALQDVLYELKDTGCVMSRAHKALGVSAGRVNKLLWHRVLSEEEAEAVERRNAEVAAEHQRWREEWRVRSEERKSEEREWRAQQREAMKQEKRDEQREAKANTFACLIEALEAMRPYDDIGPMAAVQ